MITSWHASAANIMDLYARHAAASVVARGNSSFVERIWIDRFLTETSQRDVLDIGCGFGHPIAQHIVGAGYALTGVDTSPPLIAECRNILPEAKLILADMRRLDLGERFGGILAWDSFFHLTPDDQRAMFPVFRAHSAPGAALMFTSGPHFGEAIGTFEGEPLYHGSLSEAEYRALLEAHGFDVLAYSPNDQACGRHTIWLAKAR